MQVIYYCVRRNLILSKIILSYLRKNSNMIQYNSLRKKGFNFGIDKKLMKKKILLKLKQCILSLRKTYNNQKEIVIDFLKSDLSGFLETDDCKEKMETLQVHDELELKLATLNIYKCYFTDEEHQKWYDYIIKMAKKSTKRKLVQ